MPSVAAPGIAPVNPQPNNAPVAPPPEQPRAIPGFDPAGQPLGDADVWNLFVGKRPVNTAHAHTKQKIDGREQKELLKLLTKSPKEFLQRLMADSMNGSPVEYTFTKELKGFGVGTIVFKAENGHVDTTATVEVYNKAADGWLKPYLAKDARAKGTRSSIALQIAGDLNKEAGIDNIKLEARAQNFPALSPEKLQEVEKVKEEIRAVFKGKGRTREKQARVQEIVGRALAKASEMPIAFLVELITDRHNLQMDFKEKDRSTKVHAETGNGKYAITFTDIMDGDNKDEADLGAKVAGSVAEDKSKITIEEARIYTTDKLSLSWGEEDKPVLSRIGADGEKKVVDDHVAEIMMYLPMALALAGGKNIF